MNLSVSRVVVGICVSIAASGCATTNRAEKLREQYRSHAAPVAADSSASVSAESQVTPAASSDPKVTTQETPATKRETPLLEEATERAFQADTGFEVTSAGTFNSIVPFRIGGLFARRFSALLGIGFATSRSSVTVLGGETHSLASTSVNLVPTLRYAFADYLGSGLVPFLQGELIIGVSEVNGDTGGLGALSAPSSPFGVGAWLGIEYQLSHQFGITAAAGARAVGSSSSTPVAGVSSSSFNFFFVGALGVSVKL